MPSSRASIIPMVIEVVLRLEPESLLDVGVGFGKWGHLFREYTDICQASQNAGRYNRPNWKVRIDGIEGHEGYLTEMHRFLYNEIHVGDAAEIVPKLRAYDIIFMGDIIEHFDKATGMKLLADAVGKANKAVIVSTPKYETEQGACCGNELERHRSLWSAGDFKSWEGARVRTIDGDMLVAVILKAGLPAAMEKALRRSGALGVGMRERLRRIARSPRTLRRMMLGR